MSHNLIWDEKYLTGIEEIDAQHKEAFRAVNALYDAIKQGEEISQIVKLIEKLDFYVQMHFETEENYMELYDFEDSEEHKEAHKFFRDVYNQIRYSYFYVDREKAPRKDLVNMYSLLLTKTLKEWLIFHLQTSDHELAIFLQQKLNKKSE